MIFWPFCGGKVSVLSREYRVVRCQGGFELLLLVVNRTLDTHQKYDTKSV
jgi:hypothetical protein